MFELGLTLILIFGLIGLLSAIFLFIVPYWKIFSKAGKPGWAIFIPIYNIIVFLQIIGKPWWWLFLIFLIPFVFGIWALNLLSKSYGNGVGFTIGLLLLPYIFIPILGYGGKYVGPAGKGQAAPVNPQPQA